MYDWVKSRIPSGIGVRRGVSASLVLAGAGLLTWAGLQTVGVTASLPNSHDHQGGSTGDVWVDEHNDFDSAGHEMDPHLDCDIGGHDNLADARNEKKGTNFLLDVWGAGLAARSGTLTIVEMPPSGDGVTVDLGPAQWSYSGSGKQRIATVSVTTLLHNAIAHGDVAQKNQGYHFKLDLVQILGSDNVDVKHKVFWISCAAPAEVSSTTTTTTTTTPTTTTTTTPTATTTRSVSSTTSPLPTASVSATVTSRASTPTTTAPASVKAISVPATGTDPQIPLGIGLAMSGAGLLGLRGRRRP